MFKKYTKKATKFFKNHKDSTALVTIKKYWILVLILVIGAAFSKPVEVHQQHNTTIANNTTSNMTHNTTMDRLVCQGDGNNSYKCSKSPMYDCSIQNSTLICFQ